MPFSDVLTDKLRKVMSSTSQATKQVVRKVEGVPRSLSKIPGKARLPTGKETMRFLLSELGLVLVIAVYIVLGGLLFRHMEYDTVLQEAVARETAAKNIEVARANLKLSIVNETETMQRLSENVALHVKLDMEYELMVLIKRMVNDYHQQVTIIQKEAISSTGYTGVVTAAADEVHGWSVTSAILFTATVLTTIGYGHVAPSTDIGKLVLIGYAVIAVPILTIFISKVSALVSNVMRMMYNHVLCNLCIRRRLKSHGYDDMRDYHNITAYNNDFQVPGLLVVLLAVFYALLGTLIFGLWGNGWTFVNSLYCVMVTLTTIGFGDFVPGYSGKDSNGAELLFTAVYVMIGLALLAAAISASFQSGVNIAKLAKGAVLAEVVPRVERIEAPAPKRKDRNRHRHHHKKDKRHRSRSHSRPLRDKSAKSTRSRSRSRSKSARRGVTPEQLYGRAGDHISVGAMPAPIAPGF